MTAKQVKAYNVTVSGTYKNSKGEIVDFKDLKGKVPMCSSPELAEGLIRKRYAPMWLMDSPKYPDRATRVREVFIDKMEEIESPEFSYVGKNILELDYHELQDLATAKDLRAIPLYKSGGLRQAVGIAYAEYSTKVLGRKVNHRDAGFNVAKLPPIVVDAGVEKNTPRTLSNDEVLAQEGENQIMNDSRLSRAELEQLAKEKNISFNKAITDEALHAKIFNVQD